MTGRIKRNETAAPTMGLPLLGRIKTGYKDPKGYPRSTDHFIATGKYSTLFDDVYGEKPNIIQIIFVSDDPSVSCNEKYEYYNNEGRLFADGDGENFRVWNEKAAKYNRYTLDSWPEIMTALPGICSSKKGWEITLTLNFILPKLNSIMGYWSYTTKGAASSVNNIRDSFDSMMEFNGTCKGVLFDLSVAFAKSRKPGINSKYPVTSLIANESARNKEIINSKKLLTQ